MKGERKRKRTYTKKIINRKETGKKTLNGMREREAQSGMGKRDKKRKKEKEKERERGGNKFRAFW